MAGSLSASGGKAGSRGNCAVMDGAGAPEAREVAVLTDGRPPWWHRALVPALPAGASGGGELTSIVFGVGKGAGSAPRQAQAFAA